MGFIEEQGQCFWSTEILPSLSREITTKQAVSSQRLEYFRARLDLKDSERPLAASTEEGGSTSTNCDDQWVCIAVQVILNHAPKR